VGNFQKQNILAQQKLLPWGKKYRASSFYYLGPVSRKPRKLFGPVKAFLVNLYLNNRAVYTPETSCMKETSVHIKNMLIKQLLNHIV